MAQSFPLHRPSFASLEDDGYFSARSSQPASRLMSVFAQQEHDQLAEDDNSATRPSEPLASICLPLAESALSPIHEKPPISESLADSHDHDPRHHSSNSINRSRAQKPSAETDTAYQGRLPLVTQAQLDGHMNKQEIDNILRNVRGYLFARQNGGSCGKPATPIATANQIMLPPFQAQSENSYLETQTPALREDQYLITTDDIVRILDIVVTGVRKLQDESIRPECQPLLFPSNTRVKPTLRTENIIPGAPTIADPATTICLPTPCFSWADSLEVFRYPSPTAVTTYGMMKAGSLLPLQSSSLSIVAAYF